MKRALILLFILIGCSEIEYNETLMIINSYRANESLLTWSNELQEIAKIHSTYMDKTGIFSHAWEDGTSVTDRAKMIGYEYRGIGENIAKGNHTAKSVIDSWMKSAGHRANIMEPRFNNVGMSNVGDYWVMVLSD